MSNPTLRLEELLSETVAEAALREQAAFARSLEQTDGTVVLFGAGRLGWLCARALRRAGVPHAAFCDSNVALQGTHLDGIQVLAPIEAAARFGPNSLFVVSIWTGSARESMEKRREFLSKLGCRKVEPYSALAWAHGENEIPFHSFQRPAEILAHAAPLRALIGLLTDPESLACLCRDLERRLRGKFDSAEPASNQYFPDFIPLDVGESFVDGGAYDGDTLFDFVRRTGGSFAHYHAIEPDPTNLARLRTKVAALPSAMREQISIHDAALYRQDTDLEFEAAGTVGSAITSTGRTRVAGRRLDSLLAGSRVTFLKLDIEGAERDALMGGMEVLRAQQPTVAVCVYHLPDHLWTIPLFLHDALPKHRLFFRAHGIDGWETVCYAVPPVESK